MMTKSCYVHVPFCASICAYCDFARVIYDEDLKKKWLSQLLLEIDNYAISELNTLYLGGGTPSILSVAELKQIASHLPKINNEFTIECNPEHINEQTLKAYSDLGINRISLGVQSFQDDLLKICQRNHYVADVYKAIECIQHSPISNYSIDLIFGLPNQTLSDVQFDIEMVKKYKIPHVSIYSLQIEENSIFGKTGITNIDEDLEADMYEYIVSELKKAGYEHYEVSSFCLDSKYSLHNLSYWQDRDFYGIGCGASGRLDGVRYDNTKNLKQYIESGPCVTVLKRDDSGFEAIMMALRTSFGLDISAWSKTYQIDFKRKYHSVLERYCDYLVMDGSCLYVNDSGMEILNTILVDFMMVE